MNNKSLNDIMNEMAGRLDAVQADRPCSDDMKSLSELEAFCQIDPVLAGLHREHLEAKAQRKELAAIHGAYDAMLEVVADMEDSAWCAMQTRYLELRGDQSLMQKAQRLMRKVRECIDEKRTEEKREKAFKLFQRMQILESMQKRKDRTIAFFEVVFILALFKVFPFSGNIQNHFARQAA